MTWKGLTLLILLSYVMASTADEQESQTGRLAVFILGLYGLGVPGILFCFLDAAVFP